MCICICCSNSKFSKLFTILPTPLNRSSNNWNGMVNLKHCVKWCWVWVYNAEMYEFVHLSIMYSANCTLLRLICKRTYKHNNWSNRGLLYWMRFFLLMSDVSNAWLKQETRKLITSSFSFISPSCRGDSKMQQNEVQGNSKLLRPPPRMINRWLTKIWCVFLN